jgi:hypothetical protein
MTARAIALEAVVALLLACATESIDAPSNGGTTSADGGFGLPDGSERIVDAHAFVTGASIRVVDEDSGNMIGCKLQFKALEDTLTPYWSIPGDAALAWPDQYGLWLGKQAVGTGPTVFAYPCDFSLPLGPGRYQVTASYGIRYHAAQFELLIAPDAQPLIEVPLKRALDLEQWACGDFHVHSEPSFDCDVSPAQRILAAAAEGLDLFAATDHNLVTDWQKPLTDTGLAGITVLTGVEITPDIWAVPAYIGHFNLFPVAVGFDASSFENRGESVPAMFQRARAESPTPLIIQLNHPRSSEYNGFFLTTGFDRHNLAGSPIPQLDADTLEVWNGREITYYGLDHTSELLEDWFALLNAGKRWVATGSSDTHGLAASIFGYPRTCVRASRDALSGRFPPDQLVQALRAGRAVVTSGPWLDVSLNGSGPGDTVSVQGEMRLTATVVAPNWAPVERLRVVVSGKPFASESVKALPFTTSIPIPFAEDSWVVVVADAPLAVRGPVPVETALPLISMAFTNPIFVDADGDGKWTPPAP